MKKRLWSILLVACMMLTLLPFGALAADEVIYSTRDNDTVLMVSCNGAMPNYTATKPADWSSLKTTVKTVIVEEGVTSIGNFAFNGFTALESVSIPKSATKIGSSAFAGCTALESVTIPADVASIDENAFSGCSKLAKLTLAPTVKSIAQNAFKGTALEKVYFGGTKQAENLTRNGIAKTGNDKLLDLKWDVICDSDKHEFETLNARAATCTEDGYTGDSICKVCGTKNSDPKYGQKVPALSHDWGYWRLATKVTDSQDGVEQRTCTRDKSHVEKVTIPAGTKLAPAKAELLNEATESITVPNKRVNIVWLKWYADGMKTANAETTKNPFTDITENSPYYDAILWAVEKEYVSVPADKKFAPDTVVTREEAASIVGATVYDYQSDLPTEVTYNVKDGTWKIPSPTEVKDANFIYVISVDKKTASIKEYLGSAEKVVIPDKVGTALVNAIREEAFAKNANKAKITDVTIPSTVTAIGADAFNGCSKLVNVNIPEAVTVIGARAFKGCVSLTSVVVPEGVTTIDKEAFANCAKLASATLPKSLKSLAADTFASDPALKDIYFQSGEQDWIKLGDLYRNNDKVTVHYAEDASPLTWAPAADGKSVVITGCQKTASGDLVIPETLDGLPVSAIADGAFRGCDKLTSVKVPEGVTTIGFNAFYDCLGLKSVTLPKSLVKVENNAFDGTNVKDVYYGSTSQDWTNVVVKAGNDVLKSATIHYADCVTHDTELKNVKPATCEEKGYSGDEICKVCGKTIKKGEEVAALGHDWGECTVTKAATATEKGEETRVCKRDAAHTEKRDVDPVKPEEPTENFTDVNTGDWFYKAVVWAVNAKPAVTTGTTPTTFEPYNNCTRAEMVTFLYRAAGQPVVTNTVNPFTDVTAADWFYNAVLWAVQEKITTGTTPTTFSPNVQVSRAESVTFLWRFAKSPVVVTANPFTDVATADWYYNAVLWAVQADITTGTTPTTFEPTKVCTRSEIVTFLYRDFNPAK